VGKKVKGMASKFAQELTEAVQQKSWMTDTADAIDPQLQEVREVLEGLQTHLINTGDAIETHWCDPDDNCNNVCERARALMEKLEVRS